jgi:uncharacterized protein
MVDENVAKLAKLLRLMGFDSVYFNGENDTQLVNTALKENRIILTRDTHIQERRPVTGGKVKVILISADNIEEQIQQVTRELYLQDWIRPFTLCLECNQPLAARSKEAVQDRVPPYVWQTQQEYGECPKCWRLYWKGTHWEAMTRRLEKLVNHAKEDNR